MASWGLGAATVDWTGTRIGWAWARAREEFATPSTWAEEVASSCWDRCGLKVARLCRLDPWSLFMLSFFLCHFFFFFSIGFGLMCRGLRVDGCDEDVGRGAHGGDLGLCRFGLLLVVMAAVRIDLRGLPWIGFC